MIGENQTAVVRIRSLGALDEIAPVYMDLIETSGARQRSCMLSYREAKALLNTGELPIIKPYMDRQVLLDIGRLLTQQQAATGGFQRTAALA